MTSHQVLRAAVEHVESSGLTTYDRFEPGDGWKYEVVVAPLPARMQGGSPGTDVLVAVYGSAGRRCAVFSREGFLSTGYVLEKLGLFEAPFVMYANTVKAVATALGRETDAEWSS